MITLICVVIGGFFGAGWGAVIGLVIGLILESLGD